MTYEAYRVRDLVQSGDSQIMERFIGKVATAGVYEAETDLSDSDRDDSGDHLLMSVTGTVQSIAVSTADNGPYTEVVLFKGLDDPVSNRAEDSIYLIISGDV